MPESSKPALTSESSIGEESEMIRVAIVEDNPGMLHSLRRLLVQSPGIAFVGAHPSAESALKGVPEEKPNVVLMDINLPGVDGIECVRQLKAASPETVFVMHTVYEDTERLFQAVQAGASGYLLKRTEPAALLQAIREARSGGAPITSVVARKMLDVFRQQVPAPAPPPPAEQTDLSPREREVLEKIAKGFLIKEIADQLGISFGTARTYKERIYKKLHIRSRSEATARYFQKQ